MAIPIYNQCIQKAEPRIIFDLNKIHYSIPAIFLAWGVLTASAMKGKREAILARGFDPSICILMAEELLKNNHHEVLNDH